MQSKLNAAVPELALARMAFLFPGYSAGSDYLFILAWQEHFARGMAMLKAGRAAEGVPTPNSEETAPAAIWKTGTCLSASEISSTGTPATPAN